MSKPISLAEYRALRAETRTTKTVETFTEDGEVFLGIGNELAALSPMDAMRVSNMLQKHALRVLRERTRGKHIRQVPAFKGVPR